MGLDPDQPQRFDSAAPGAEVPQANLPVPPAEDTHHLSALSQTDQRRLLTNLRRVNLAIETFGETIAQKVIPTLVFAAEIPPSAAVGVGDGITEAISEISTIVAALYDTIDWFVQRGNQPLREYRNSVEQGTQDAIRLLREANPSSVDENWRVKVLTAKLRLQETISDDCEVITPNLIFTINELECLLRDDHGKGQAGR